MAAIYSELLEDYFLTNINGDLFGDDGTKDDVEEDTTTVATDFMFSESEGLPVDGLVIEHSQATSVDLVGLQVWRGALLLADFILARPDLVRDKRVLELAAGTGVTSITAGMFASAVTATDVDRGDILPLLERNKSLNETAIEKCEFEVLELDFFWDEWPKEIRQKSQDCDIILAADVVYDKNITYNFFKTLKKLLSMSPKKAFIAIEKRQRAGSNGQIVAPNYEIFLQELSDLNVSSHINVTSIEIDFKQYFKYSRVKELTLFQIQSYE